MRLDQLYDNTNAWLYATSDPTTVLKKARKYINFFPLLFIFIFL